MVCLALCILYVAEMKEVRAQSVNGEVIIEKMVQSIEQKEWDEYKTLMAHEEQAFYEYYFNDDSYTDGIKQIESIEIDDITLLSIQEAESELLYDEYPILKTADEVIPYLVALDCQVKEETALFYNGLNYFLIILVKESDGQYRISQFSRPLFDFLSNIIENELDNSAETSEKQNAALNVIEFAEKGVLVNGKGEFITDGYDVKKKNKVTNKVTDLEEGQFANKISVYGLNNYKDTPNLNAYYYYSIPSKITVCLNKTGNCIIETVPLEKYIKNVIPNECYTSWNKLALKAVAYCIKGVAIYRSIKPVNANYMVSQGTQRYVPNTAVKKTNKIVDSIKGNFMVNSAAQIFFPEYGAGSKGVAGTKGSGRLLQWGSQYLASEKGYNCKEILNYYYKGSPYSSGKLMYIGYGEA